MPVVLDACAQDLPGPHGVPHVDAGDHAAQADRAALPTILQACYPVRGNLVSEMETVRERLRQRPSHQLGRTGEQVLLKRAQSAFRLLDDPNLFSRWPAPDGLQVMRDVLGLAPKQAENLLGKFIGNEPKYYYQPDYIASVVKGLVSGMIAHSPEEFILDFIRVMPGVPKAKVRSRIIVTPSHAKRLLAALVRLHRSKFSVAALDEAAGNGDDILVLPSGFTSTIASISPAIGSTAARFSAGGSSRSSPAPSRNALISFAVC